MKDIEYYIEQSKSMPNTSDGGSAAFHFDDVVLIKYCLPNQYGAARQGEEEIAQIANELRSKGVGTPYHYAIKRETLEKTNICWVLQERAKGICYSNYKVESDPEESLRRQASLASAPLSHYEKLAKDIADLFYFELEIQPKNIYYDESPDGGFTFIDLIPPKYDRSSRF